MTKEIEDVNRTASFILNNQSGDIVYGSSTTQLVYNLVNSMKRNINRVGGEIVLADFNHESMLTTFDHIVRDIDNININILDNKRPDADNQPDTLKIKWWHLDKSEYKYTIDYTIIKLFYHLAIVILMVKSIAIIFAIVFTIAQYRSTIWQLL